MVDDAGVELERKGIVEDFADPVNREEGTNAGSELALCTPADDL